MLKSFDEIFQPIKSDMHLVTGIAAGEPQKLLSELKKRINNWKNLSLYHQLSLSPHLITNPGREKHLSYRVGFIGPGLREVVSNGRATFLPSHNSAVPANFLKGIWSVDAALIQTSPPNKNGYLSLGVSVDYLQAAVQKARIVLAQVNRHMPYTYGDSLIPLSKITAFVEYDETLLELRWRKPGPVEKKIGRFVAQLIPDGATLQMGNGVIPDAILSQLENKKDLGIHTEMFSDNLIPLVKKGVITGAKKKIDKGKIVAGFVVGTKKVYDFVHRNRKVELRSWLYTNDPFIIAKNDRVVSINSALQIDFSGQVAAESLGDYEFSGTGGQVDFVRGARLSKEGKSIIALPSTAKKGEISRIVPQLSPGTIVTTTRDDVDYIVTEYGIAELKGKSLGERARLLTSLAHPKFRTKLGKAIKKGKNKWSFQ